jgi:hypothetical protein
MAAGSYAFLGEAGAALPGKAAGPPPANPLPGEAGSTLVDAALLGEAAAAAGGAFEGEAAAAAGGAFEGEAAAAAGGAFEGEAAAAAGAAFESEAAAAAAAAALGAAAPAAGDAVPIILAIGSIAPALAAFLLPSADPAKRLVTSSSQSASKSSMFSLCCFSTNARKRSRVVASTLVL